MSEEAAEALEAKKKAKQDAQRQLRSPPRDIQTEYLVEMSRQHFEQLKRIARSLLAPATPWKCVVNREGKKALELWDGRPCVALWRKMLSAIESATAVPTMQWANVIPSLDLARVCAVYAKNHPSTVISGIAQEALDRLKQAHDRVPGMPLTAGASSHRCDGQQSYADITVPEVAIQAMRQWLRGKGPYLALLCGRRSTSGGHVLTSAYLPNQEEADNGHRSFQQQSLLDTLRFASESECVGVAVATDLLPTPTPWHLASFLQVREQAPDCRLLALRWVIGIFFFGPLLCIGDPSNMLLLPAGGCSSHHTLAKIIP